MGVRNLPRKATRIAARLDGTNTASPSATSGRMMCAIPAIPNNALSRPILAQCQGTHETTNEWGKTIYRSNLDTPECKQAMNNSTAWKNYNQCLQDNDECTKTTDDCLTYYYGYNPHS